MSDSEEERIETPPADDSPVTAADDGEAMGSDDDLFGGSDGGAEDTNDKQGSADDDEGQLSDQPLSEHGLDSEDEARYGMGDDDDDDEGNHDGRRGAARPTRKEVLMDVGVFRHRTPKSTDGTLQSLRVPPFIKIQPTAYDADTFVPTDFDLENSLAKNPHSVVRFRRDAAAGGTVQSNAAVYRWSDGSVTLAVGDEHFEVLTKRLAPPADAPGPYQELQDAHYYAAAAHLSSSLLLTVGHVTEQYSVRASRTAADDALKRLADRLQAASQSSARASANMIIRTVRDPELAKKEAELAEKERERARRRRETAAARLDGGSGRAGGGSWGGGGGGGALSVGDLEGTAGKRAGAGGRKRGGPGGAAAAAAARAKRRRDEYDSDDELPRGARRNDEYDKGDDFIAPSDEDDSDDDEAGEDDDDEEVEDEEDEEDEDEGAGRKARRTKRQRTAEAEDEDAEGDDDDDMPTARRARRHIVDDDDDE